MKYKILRTKILLLVTIVTILVSTILSLYNYKLRENILYEVSIEKFFILTKTIHNFKNDQLNLYTARFEKLVQNKLFIQGIQLLDVKKINKALESPNYYYSKANKSFKNIHIYNKQGELIFNYDDEHLKKSNTVVKQALLTKSQEAGYVLYNNNSFYSLVFPIGIKDKIIGFVEFQVESDYLLKLASKAGRYKYAIYLNENKSTKTLGKRIASNSKIFDDIDFTQEYIYKIANKNSTVNYKDKHYLIHQYDVETYFQKDLLQVILLSDTTKYIDENNDAIIVAVEAMIVGLFVILIFIYFVLTKLINRLIYDEEQLLINTKQMEVIMDNSDNLIAFINN